MPFLGVKMVVSLARQPLIEGHGLVLRPWDEDLARQLAGWGERGFPFQAFDLGHLRDPVRAAAALATTRDGGSHRHYIACEGDIAVGRVAVNFRDQAGLYLWSVHVPPEHEGRGVCRRMLAALMTGLESDCRPASFALTTNTFAARAHRAYFALGFEIAHTRWHYDHEIAQALWKVSPAEREPVASHVRFHNGRWETRVHLMKRLPGTRMDLGRPSSG